MPGRIAAWTVLCILALCALNACAKPKYIIPGLTLPPSATVVKFTNVPHKGSSGREVFIEFNCQGGWDVVLRHVDQCMLKAGYRNVTADIIESERESRSGNGEGFEELNPVMAEPDSPDEVQKYTDEAKCFRLYRKQGSKSEVHLLYAFGFYNSPTDKARRAGRGVTKWAGADYYLTIFED
jgi:hypothetical protein